MYPTNVHKKAGLLLLLFVAFCQLYAQENQSFYFTEVQPANSTRLDKFPEKLIGNYNGSDSTLRLIITEDKVFSRFYVLFTTTLEKVDSREDIYLQDGEIFGLSSQSFPYELIGDTVYLYYPNEYTLFSVGDEGNALVQGNSDQLFMNIQEENGQYTTHMLELNDDSLYMRSFDHFSAWDSLQEITELKSKKVKGEKAYLATVEEGEFDNLIMGFSEMEWFVKQIEQ